MNVRLLERFVWISIEWKKKHIYIFTVIISYIIMDWYIYCIYISGIVGKILFRWSRQVRLTSTDCASKIICRCSFKTLTSRDIRLFSNNKEQFGFMLSFLCSEIKVRLACMFYVFSLSLKSLLHTTQTTTVCIPHKISFGQFHRYVPHQVMKRMQGTEI